MACGNAPFSIHQELWHDCWVAATSAMRSSRKMQRVDFDIQQRVARLMEEYGPHGGMPLTLRVYGTMIKGFCVINNDRAKTLHVDCERLVYAFAQLPFGDEGKAMKLPPAKRKLADALTLDLDLARVQESEAFDWTQAPLEEGALLRLLPPDEAPLAAPGGALIDVAPPLLASGELLEVTFPGLGIPMQQEPIDLTKPPEDAAQQQHQQPHQHQQPMDFVELVAQQPAPMQVEDAGQVALERLAALQQSLQQHRGPRRPAFEPGRVFGFDEESTMPLEVWETWGRDDSDITRPRVRPAGNAQRIMDGAVDRSGRLRSLLDAPELSRRGSDAGVGTVAAALLRLREAHAPPSAQEPPSAIVPFEAPPPMAEPQARPDLLEEPPHVGSAAPAFEMSAPPPPMEAEFQGGPAQPGSPGAQAGVHDDQTAQVAEVLRHYLSMAVGSRATLDDLLPPSATDRATAARTFHALLSLATSGDFLVAQSMPYAPIGIAVV